MTDIHGLLNRLEAAAKDGTQGKFKAWDSKDDEDGRVSVQHCPDSQMHEPQLLLVGGLETGCDCLTALTIEDARHIAESCPTNVLQVIAECRKLHEVLSFFEEQSVVKQLQEARAEIARLKELLEQAPHAEGCGLTCAGIDEGDDCNCWKSEL